LAFWDVSTGQLLWRRRIHHDARYERLLAFSPDGASFADYDVRTRIVRSREILTSRTQSNLALTGTGDVRRESYAPDGRTFALGVWRPKTRVGDRFVGNDVVILWDIQARRELARHELDGDVSLLLLSPGGTMVATGRRWP